MKSNGLLVVFLFVFLCSGPTLKAQTLDSSSSLPRFSLEMKQKSREVILDSLASLYKIYISYDPVLINAGERVSVSQKQVTLDQMIAKIVDPSKVAWHLFDDQLVLYARDEQKTAMVKDSMLYFTIEGKICDSRKKNPIPYCNISVGHLAMGTITNEEGLFSLKIPASVVSDSIRFSCVGYASSVMAIADIVDKNFLEIKLRRVSIQLGEIDVILASPIQILNQFNKHISDNYETKYCLYTTYYRELIKEEDSFVEISEAILEVLKSSYKFEPSFSDHIKFVKGRKSSEFADSSLVRLKLKGGPYYINHLDVVKTKESFLNPEYWYLYKYEYAGSKLIDGRKNLVIRFEPIYEERQYLYEGKLYFDMETKALARAEYGLPKSALKRASSVLVEHQPKGFKCDMNGATYIVQYELNDDKWHLKMARTEMNVRLTDKEKNRKIRFQSISEILTTQISCKKLHHFGNNEIFRSSDYVTEKIDSFDAVFWGNYNVIKPEEALERALKKPGTIKTEEHRLN